MHLFSKYSYIWKFPSEQEQEYSKFVQPSNIISLRLVSFITLFGMTLFLIIDFFRNVDYSVVLGTRAFILVVSIAVMVYSFQKTVTSRGIMWSIVVLTFCNLGVATVTATFAGMPSYYLTNLLFLVLVLVVTATGLHFRHGLFLNTVCLLLFIMYSQYIRVDPFYVSQYPHLFSIFIYIHIVGLVLESRRRSNFLQFSELNRQKKLVEDLNNQKSKIISILSHDIASPVHSLLGIVNLEKKGVINAEEIKPLMENVGEELSRVHTLMFSLMRWSKSQLEGFNVTPSTFNIKTLIQENIQLFQRRIELKQLTVEIHQQNELWARADIEMIRLVMRNLLSNAVKFSPLNSIITIEILMNKDLAQIEISNDGQLIPREIQEQLFGFQVPSLPGTLNEKGSGLGLALARYFAELNNGSLVLVPYSNKNFTTFRLQLPLAHGVIDEVAIEVQRKEV